MAWIIVNLWSLLGLAVFIGPLVLLWWYWDRKDTPWKEQHLRAGLPEPKLASGEVALRWGIGLAVFFVSGLVGSKMWEMLPAIERAAQ